MTGRKCIKSGFASDNDVSASPSLVYIVPRYLPQTLRYFVRDTASFISDRVWKQAALQERKIILFCLTQADNRRRAIRRFNAFSNDRHN